MKVKEERERLRDLDADELRQEIDQRKESLFRLRFKLALGERDAVKSIRSEKKTLARAQTLLRQK
jgi:large subunit ribosomal protein L29